ncbi:MAG: Obg family GTPase CgtA [Mycoplasma sp.]
MKYWTHRDDIIKLNQKLQTVGVESYLKTLGAKQGDIIKIYNVELQYEESNGKTN